MSAQRRSRQSPRPSVTKTRKPKSRVLGAELGRLLHKSRWLVAALMALHLLLAYLVLQPAPHTGGDNAGYLTLAKSILERGTYQDLYDSTEPPHTQYPPVFPLILAGATAIGLQPWVPLKFVIIAFSTLAVGFTYLWIRRRGRPELAFGVALIMAVSPGVLELTHWELSDVPFWAITMVAVYAWDRLRPGDYRMLALAVIMTTLAYLTRSAGLPLVVAAIAWLTWRKRWRELGAFLLVFAPFALWWWWRARAQGGVDYVGQFWFVDPYQPALGRIGVSELLERMRENGVKYMRWHLPVLLFGGQRFRLISVLIILLGIYGWGVRMRRPRISEFFLPLYIGLLLIWPAVWSGERFLLPAVPFILFYAGDAVVRLLRMTAPAFARLVPAALAALIVLLGLPQLSQAMVASRQCMALYRLGDKYACLPDQWKDFFAVAEAAPRVLPEDAAVLSRKARTFYIVGGVAGRNYPLSADPDTFFREAAEAKARYVLFDRLDGLSQAYLAPVLVNRSNRFCIVFGLGQDRATLFGILPAPAAASADGAQFTECGNEFWRSTAVKDSLFGETLQLR
jgi:hypothetical protein